MGMIVCALLTPGWSCRHWGPQVRVCCDWGSASSEQKGPSPQVDFIWINRDQRSFEWFVSLLIKLEMDQAEMTQEGRRGAGPGEDGSRWGFGLRGLLRGCLDYSISIKNVGERGTVFLPPPKCNIYKTKKRGEKGIHHPIQLSRLFQAF